MAKKKNTGKIGEMIIINNVTEMVIADGENLDFTRHTITNTPDRGEDLNLKAPENIREKFNDILRTGETEIESSSTLIDIRVDVKNKKVDKDDAEKFIDDKKKNPKSDEHWLIGRDISDPAKTVLEEANKHNSTKPVMFYTFDDFKNLTTYYQLLENDEDE